MASAATAEAMVMPMLVGELRWASPVGGSS